MKKALLVCCTLAIVGQAHADFDPSHSKRCKNSDLNGTWVSYQAEVLANPHTGKCVVNIWNGVAKGTCDFSLENPPGVPLTDLQFDGTVQVDGDCSVDLTMDFTPYGRPFVSTFQLQLARDKQTYAGRWSNTFGALGTTNGVKR